MLVEGDASPSSLPLDPPLPLVTTVVLPVPLTDAYIPIVWLRIDDGRSRVARSLYDRKLGQLSRRSVHINICVCRLRRYAVYVMYMYLMSFMCRKSKDG